MCGAERTGLFKVGADTMRSVIPAHLVPAQHREPVVKPLAVPVFKATGAGAYTDRLQA